MKFLTVIGMLCLLSAVAYGSLYRWVDTNRPPVSLAEALARGDKLLGHDRERYYCINAHIYGNKEGDGKGGAWNLLYGTKDGSRKHVSVNMQGKAAIQDWNGPVDWTANAGRRVGLVDVETRLMAVLNSQELTPDKVERTNDSLTLSRATRQFSLHKLRGDGTYSVDTQPVVGPDLNGIWIHVDVVKRQPPEAPYRWEGPYWNLNEENYLLADGKGFLVVEIRYGDKFPHKVVQQIDQVFGDRLPSNRW